MPNRRRFLRVAGIGAVGLAAAGGVVAVALTRDQAPTDQAESTPPTGAPPPNGPAPTWTRALGATFNSGDLGVMGDVLVRWDQRTAQAFDAATGAPRWKGQPTLPAGAESFSWIGLHGSSLFGAVYDVNVGTNLFFALGPDGKQQFTHDLDGTSGTGGFSQVHAVANGVAMLTKSGSGSNNKIVAVDVSSGKQLWSRPLKAYNSATVVVDGQRCYLQDITDTFCLDLTTGNQLWATPDTCANTKPSVVFVAGALAINGHQLVVLDAATGVQRQTAVKASTGSGKVGVSADLLVVSDDDRTVWGIDPRSGTKVWATHSPVPLGAGGGTTLKGLTTSADLVVVPTRIEISVKPAGFLVLNGRTGAIAWAVSGDSTEDWLVCPTPNAIHAASSTTVHAYPHQL